MTNNNDDVLTYGIESCGYSECAPCNVRNYEMRSRNVLHDYLDSLYATRDLKGVFVDVGAHVGLWSLAMSAFYQARFNITPAIYAFEPLKANYEVLKRNAEQDETGITPVHAAAWNREQTMRIFIDNHPARGYVTEQTVDPSAPAHVETIKCVTLDAVSRGSRLIDAMKIDVEGAELRVLNGARELLDANERMLLLVEFCAPHLLRYGNTTHQLDAFLRTVGFTPHRELDETMLTLILKDEAHKNDLALIAYRKGSR